MYGSLIKGAISIEK